MAVFYLGAIWALSGRFIDKCNKIKRFSAEESIASEAIRGIDRTGPAIGSSNVQVDKKLTIRPGAIAAIGITTVFLGGLLIDQATAAQLEISSETSAFSHLTLSEGSVSINLNYTPPDYEALADDVGEHLRYQVYYDGKPFVGAATEAFGFSSVSLQDLDGDRTAEVIVKNFSGGAHCCTNTVVYSWQEDDFSQVETGYLDGDGGQFEDLDGDGNYEFVSADNAFLYAFSSYAGSFPPPLVMTFSDGTFTETTRQYPDLIREHIASIEGLLAESESTVKPNGLLASYVASKTLLGEYESGWAYLLEHYDKSSEWGLNIYSADGEVVGSYPDFPTALRAFLEETGYLSPQA